MFSLVEHLVGCAPFSFLILCLFSLGAEYHSSDAPSELAIGPPSETGGAGVTGVTVVGIIPGVLLRVFLTCTLGVALISSGCVGLIDICGRWAGLSGK